MDQNGIKLELCQGNLCCYTGFLDNPQYDDYENCHVNDFYEDQISECNGYSFKENIPISVRINHYSSDSWFGDYISILTTKKYIFCPLNRWLNSYPNEVYLQCYQ